MNLLSKFASVAAVAFCTAGFASADTLYLGSFASQTASSTPASNPGFSNSALSSPASQATYTLAPGNTWSAPMSVNGTQSTWVGINPGDGFNPGVPSNYEPNGMYVYHSYFNVTSTASLSGYLTAMADDTLDVYLNGNHVIFNSMAGGDGFVQCSAMAPNCITPVTGALLNSYFVTGQNDLQFDVYQANSYQTGLDFVGVVATPEPSSLLLLGTGLVGSAGAMFRKMRSVRS